MLACRENDNKKSENEIKRMHLHQQCRQSQMSVFRMMPGQMTRSNNAAPQHFTLSWFVVPSAHFSKLIILLPKRTFYFVIVL